MNDSQPLDERFIILEYDHFQELLAALTARSYRLVGPTLQGGAVVYDEIETVTDMPIGWADEQDGGLYRLEKRDDDMLFGYNAGPQSWKRFLHLPAVRLWKAQTSNNGFEITPEMIEAPSYAFIGVRACELHAIRIQDRIFLEGAYVDPLYKTLREKVFIVAVNCSQAGGTCFCASMGTGPAATPPFDLALTEILDENRHDFLVEIGSERGKEISASLTQRPASQEDLLTSQRIIAQTAASMGRTLQVEGLKFTLYNSYEHPQWDKVASRCLTCGNCTMVCPTCFCNTVEDVTDLTGEQAERWRKWDSCFTMDFSYIHGGSVRYTAKARYRQWMTHKLATWWDQFGTSGCVGCGRCITWCPVGIDLTEEARAIQAGSETSKDEVK